MYNDYRVTNQYFLAKYNIDVKNILKYEKNKEICESVLKNINLEINPGEFLIILGPSGSGKSTLLNHILGLEQPTTGQVSMCGNVITGLKANAIARLRYKYFGIVFQRPDWINSISVLQNVMLPLAIHNVAGKVRTEKAWTYLKDVDMADHAAYPPNQLSGGQQQKIALARAMVNDPPVYIADEPTGNLDSVSAVKVMDTFKRLNQEMKRTVIMVTHNIEYVRYGSRTIYIRDGMVVDGAAGMMMNSPQ
jgi:putative ABC transport system ATP-binding protein